MPLASAHVSFCVGFNRDPHFQRVMPGLQVR